MLYIVVCRSYSSFAHKLHTVVVSISLHNIYQMNSWLHQGQSAQTNQVIGLNIKAAHFQVVDMIWAAVYFASQLPPEIKLGFDMLNWQSITPTLLTTHVFVSSISPFLLVFDESWLHVYIQVFFLNTDGLQLPKKLRVLASQCSI